MNFRLDDNYWRRERIIELARETDDRRRDQISASLRSMNGISNFEFADKSLTISYDLRLVCLRAINKVLRQYNLPLNRSRLYQIKNFITEYQEAIRVEEEHIDYGWDVWVQDAYVSRYRLRRHGRRDDRLTNWRAHENNSTSAIVPAQANDATQSTAGISPHG
ncbi:MAG: hypothetical protein ACU84Q_00215 [Gammaproteobacteria bacterium]